MNNNQAEDYEMQAYHQCRDTSTLEYNLDRFKGIGLAMLASKYKSTEAGRNVQRVVPLGYGYDELADWLATDFKEKSKLIKSMVSALAFLQLMGVDETVNLSGKVTDGLKSDVDEFVSGIEAGLAFSCSPETKGLAQQVVQMNPDSAPVEDWAELLAQDTSKGTD